MEGGEPTAANWKWFGAMDEVLGDRPPITPPVLITSSSAVPPPHKNPHQASRGGHVTLGSLSPRSLMIGRHAWRRGLKGGRERCRRERRED